MLESDIKINVGRFDPDAATDGTQAPLMLGSGQTDQLVGIMSSYTLS